MALAAASIAKRMALVGFITSENLLQSLAFFAIQVGQVRLQSCVETVLRNIRAGFENGRIEDQQFLPVLERSGEDVGFASSG